MKEQNNTTSYNMGAGAKLFGGAGASRASIFEYVVSKVASG
jgi:hypothetical protein